MPLGEERDPATWRRMCVGEEDLEGDVTGESGGKKGSGRDDEQETVESPRKREEMDGWQPGRWGASKPGHRVSLLREERRAGCGGRLVRGARNAGN